ncbi:MAG: KEOPS complex subunit Pcc1 [Candidatus Hydrothermarchaeaceae archaeon]|jgi:hypothetical protein
MRSSKPCTASITFEYDDGREAEVVAKMLEVDNRVAPKKLRIETVHRENMVITNIEHEQPGTIFATVDDLIFTERLISSLIGVKK